MTAATIVKRLQSLEQKKEGSLKQKIFIYHMERNPPSWEPGDLGEWQKLNPNGQAILLKRKSFSKSRGDRVCA